MFQIKRVNSNLPICNETLIFDDLDYAIDSISFILVYWCVYLLEIAKYLNSCVLG